MDNNVMKFGYEDTDKKIEIELYELRFEIKNLDSKNIDELKNIEKNEEVLEKLIEELLGEGAINKINDKRVSDGHEKLTLEIEIQILGCIFETYANSAFSNTFDRVNGTIEKINNKMNNYNRSQRRYNNKYNNRYNNRRY